MGWIINSINSFTSFFWKMYTAVVSFFNMIWNFLSYIFSILKTLWYWAVTLFSWISELINDIFWWTFFGYLWSTLNDLSFYIGSFWAYLFWWILIVIFVRIWISFVFKVLRLNVDYNTLKKKFK